jgi:hypothetical protein
MKKNMGAADRMVRVGLAIVIAILYLTHIISGNIALVLLFVLGALLITSLFSFCPLYAVLGMKTHKTSKYRKPTL